ncbi:hypothetical protein JTB14_006343 [Gonioctena quinquepunctata]|nr:hypothetical protein JTB14_006343 [Gonioctena quinquepunctata]
MFMPRHITNISNHTGTQRILLVFGEYPTNAEKVRHIHRKPSVIISLLIPPYHTNAVGNRGRFPAFRIEIQVCPTQRVSSCPTPYDYFHTTRRCSVCPTLRVEIQVCSASFTVQALYEGLLVTSWTTAQRRQRRWSCSAQLATLLVLVATLTIVERCYAAPLVQLYTRPSHDSKRPTSSLVLSRLFSSERDTSLIREYNPKHDRNETVVRSKREFEQTALRNRISRLRSKFPVDGNSTFEDYRTSRYEQLSAGEGGGSVEKTRVTLNATFERENQQNDSRESAERGSDIRSTQRPMPPAHAQDDDSGEFNFFSDRIELFLEN